MRFLLILAVVLLLSSGAAEAAEYHMIGGGTRSCGTWTADRRELQLAHSSGRLTPGSQDSLQEQAWVLGFLSGVGDVYRSRDGANGDNPLDDIDAEGVWAWIDNRCRAYPIEKIATAAEAFYHAHPHR